MLRRILEPGLPSYVTSILNNEIEVEARSPEHKALLKKLGARRALLARSLFTFRYGNNEEQAKIMQALRDAGIAFLAISHGWPPAAIFELFRERGAVQGTYTQVTFATGGPIVTPEC